MKIKFIDIQNFRKLKNCRLELSDKETVFVGANNSGKTSAMDMLIKFLIKNRRKELATTDFTLSNWHAINSFGQSWVDGKATGIDAGDWHKVCPALDIWIEVQEKEVYRVCHLIPTLGWKHGLLGVRLCFEPKKIADLQSDFVAEYTAAQEVLAQVPQNEEAASQLTVWPRNVRDFLDKSGKLHSYFAVKSYLLDPSKVDLESEEQSPQSLSKHISLEGEPFDGLFRIDLIEAQRGFSDANSDVSNNFSAGRGNLSQQLKKYYQKHLDPSESPDIDDLKALQSIDQAKTTFDTKLRERLQSAISEIENIGYPGFSDPSISLTSKINPIDSLDHDTAIQFDLFKSMTEGLESLRLPEKLNGLGYKNLISMIFALLSFRDGWMRLGKAAPITGEPIEPLHLVLIEEPEAHLHAQVQQVFINKAYQVLRKHPSLGENSTFQTQLIVSTHSSYLAHEVEFENLRYFRRKRATSQSEAPTAKIVNLRSTFGARANETAKYVARYLKTTHCDLFFANGVILVEGAAERMLVPHFIKQSFKKLSTSYISILEINGAHAHRLKPLLDKLGIHTLVIADLDSKAKTADGAGDESYKKAPPTIGMNQITDNTSLKQWIPKIEEIDKLIAVDEAKMVSGVTRVAYQKNIEVSNPAWNGGEILKVIPYTFEDALVFSNIDTFKKLEKTTGMLKKMVLALNLNNLETARNTMFKELQGEKAKMALDILFDVDPTKLNVPHYIAEGLSWLEAELSASGIELIDALTKPTEEPANA